MENNTVKEDELVLYNPKDDPRYAEIIEKEEKILEYMKKD